MFSLKTLSLLLLLFVGSPLFAQKDKPNLGKNRQGESMTFDEASCAKKELEIVKFQDFGTKKVRQVVIGRDIFYKGKPKSATNWDWELPDWPSFNGNRDSYNKGRITVNDLPVNNDYFEEDFVVEVSADIEGDGVLEQASSTDEPDGWNFKVFFLKDDTNFGNPNWFYYWKQAPDIVALLDIPGIKLYDVGSCRFTNNPVSATLALEYRNTGTYVYNPSGNTTYGSNFFGVGNMDRLDPDAEGCPDLHAAPSNVAYNYIEPLRGDSRRIIIGEGCGFKKGADEGIQAFYTTVIHEREHAIIECEIWGNGYDSFYDMDHDGYNDNWETSPTGGAGHGFTIGAPFSRNDEYESGYNPSDLGTGTLHAGTDYEEARCRNEEAAATLNIIDIYDWSFDPTGSIQGKQW